MSLVYDFICDLALGLVCGTGLSIVAAIWMHKSMRVNVLVNGLISILLLIFSIVQLTMFFGAGTTRDRLDEYISLGKACDAQAIASELPAISRYADTTQMALDSGIAYAEWISSEIGDFRTRRTLWLGGAIVVVVCVGVVCGRGRSSVPLSFDSGNSSSQSLNF